MSFLKMQLNFFNNKHLILCVLCALCGNENSCLTREMAALPISQVEFVVITSVQFVDEIR